MTDTACCLSNILLTFFPNNKHPSWQYTQLEKTVIPYLHYSQRRPHDIVLSLTCSLKSIADQKFYFLDIGSSSLLIVILVLLFYFCLIVGFLPQSWMGNKMWGICIVIMRLLGKQRVHVQYFKIGKGARKRWPKWGGNHPSATLAGFLLSMRTSYFLLCEKNIPLFVLIIIVKFMSVKQTQALSQMDRHSEMGRWVKGVFRDRNNKYDHFFNREKVPKM